MITQHISVVAPGNYIALNPIKSIRTYSRKWPRSGNALETNDLWIFFRPGVRFTCLKTIMTVGKNIVFLSSSLKPKLYTFMYIHVNIPVCWSHAITVEWFHFVNFNETPLEKVKWDYTRLLCIDLNESWKQQPTQQLQYGDLLPISRTLQGRREIYVRYCLKN